MINKFRLFIVLVILLFNCKSIDQIDKTKQTTNEFSFLTDFTIAFGSCNKQNEVNMLWDDILRDKPNMWIWGGDNIYSDTRDMNKLKSDYSIQLANKDYKALTETVKIMGTWDDHDYGLNDGGIEFDKKKESQQLFLDFIGVDSMSSRRSRAGVYHKELITTKKGSIKIIVLDTRYFRSALVPNTDSKKRYQPSVDENATILGKAQWNWLNQELITSNADFNIIVSSIQFLSNEHGFETWGNFPLEVEKLKTLIIKSKAKGVVLLSGDRHISEFSKTNIKDLEYPLIDFTSSGLTHSYTSFTEEPNLYRHGKVISDMSYGLLKFNFKKRSITMEMKGNNNKTLQVLTQHY